MEDDIQNYLPTVMFRGTPCSKSQINAIYHVPDAVKLALTKTQSLYNTLGNYFMDNIDYLVLHLGFESIFCI